MAPPTWLASGVSEYLVPGSTITVDGGASFFVAILADGGSADSTSGFTLGGFNMTGKVTPYFPNFNGFYGAYMNLPPGGARVLNWSGVDGPYASCRFTSSFSGVGAVASSGVGYNAPGAGETSFGVTVTADSNSLAVACMQLAPAQRAAVLTPMAGCTIRADVSGDGRHIVVTAPGIGSTPIGVTSSVGNSAGVTQVYSYVLTSVGTGTQYVKMRIKLRGT